MIPPLVLLMEAQLPKSDATSFSMLSPDDVLRLVQDVDDVALIGLAADASE
jgi:hypothetical protein